ncbi:MAG: 16S rRNA (cytosine(967)-C(5))-methyltransferase RsmB [Desulfobacterales bacterium]|nr:16S rRNA (cytosine(967)-C(5))-methyltransferase RsmB [Desulfobacterales bacterium]
MENDPRLIAFNLLESGQKTTLPLDRAIEDASEDLNQLSRKDRALTNAIVFGVFRHRGQIDHIIKACSKISFDRLEGKVKTLLRMGIFQIIFLDRVPDFAAIHSIIELAKIKTGKKTSGFINAVLRKAAKSHKDISLPPRRNFTAFTSAAYSIPSWLGKRWVAMYGKNKTENLCQSVLKIPPLTLRVNSLRTNRGELIQLFESNGLSCNKSEFSLVGLDVLTSGKAVPDFPGFDDGYFQVQDEAAQLAVQLLSPKPGERILDACAGLGTKTCHIGLSMDNKGEVIANDIGSEKIDRIEPESKRLGITIIKTTSFDMIRAGRDNFGGYFDRVLVDAPCTGLGVIRRNPDTRWKRSKKDILRMAALQKKILNGAANLVTPGGVIVFAVCSCEPEENQEVISHFLNKRKDFEPDPLGFMKHLPLFSKETPDKFQLATYPDYTNMDGFFVARLRRIKRA